jgi:hypothetical protein
MPDFGKKTAPFVKKRHDLEEPPELGTGPPSHAAFFKMNC